MLQAECHETAERCRHDIRHTITIPAHNVEQNFFTYRSLSNRFKDIIQSVPSNLKESLLQQY